MLTPVLPHYVEKSLGGGDVAVGIAVGAFAVGAILLRPTPAGSATVGRRVLIVGGALVVGVSAACYGLVHVPVVARSLTRSSPASARRLLRRGAPR